MADMYQFEEVAKACEQYCLKDPKHKVVSFAKKVAVLDKFKDKLPELKKALLKEVKKPRVLSKLNKTPEYKKVSAELKLELAESFQSKYKEVICHNCEKEFMCLISDQYLVCPYCDDSDSSDFSESE